MKDTAAIIVAGGKGRRFGGGTRKQYLRLKGRPLVWWSLQAFRRAPSIAEIVLVVPKDDLKRSLGTVPTGKRRGSLGTVPTGKRRASFRVVAGGKTRADSVRAGLQALGPTVRWVAVHDAVRPLVRANLIEKVIRAARQFKAAIAACPSKDTVKLSNGNQCIHSTPPRESVWLAQTPQVFERKILERAHVRGRHLAVTDDAQLVERLGVRVRLVEAPVENVKITRPMDLELAKCIVSE